MSHPNPYHPDTSFADAAINNVGGRSTIDATKLDKELSAVSESINKTVDNIKIIQRDDGRLKDAAVEIHTLSREVLMLLGRYRLRGFWTPDSDFLVGDVASNDSFLYVCVIAHKSGLSFVEAPNWQRFGFAGSADAAQAAAQATSAASQAISSATAAQSSATIATTKASDANASAANASTSASTAQTAATSASNSAAQATSANNAAQTAAAVSQAAATTSGIANSRIVYGDDESKTILVGSADLAVASGFYETSSDVPSAGKWLINNIKSKTGAEIIQSAISTSDPTQRFTRKITGAVKTPWEQIAGSSILKTAFTTSGTAPTYVGAFTPAATALSPNLRAQVTVHVANGGAASTLNVNGLGAKSIKRYDSTGTLVDAVLFTNQKVDLVYDGTYWVVLNNANKVDSGNARAAESDLFIAPLSSMQVVNNSLSFTAPSNGRLIVDSILWVWAPFTSASGGMECTTTVTGQTTKIGESLVNVFLSFAAQVSKGDVINMNHAVKNKSTTLGSPAARSVLRYFFIPS